MRARACGLGLHQGLDSEGHKRWQDSASETVQVVLPNDSNPLGYILGGTVMHLIDITGAIACHRHTNTLALTAGVDSLDFIHPIKVGDLIILEVARDLRVQDVARSRGRSVFGSDSDAVSESSRARRI